MLRVLAVQNYRSIGSLVVPLGALNVVTGPNGSGKSNLYRALRLLAETARGGAIEALAREGGLASCFWAGPENISRRMREAQVPIEASVRKGARRLRLGFGGDDFGYAIAFGLPQSNSGENHQRPSAFSLDPEIKLESIWAGEVCRPAATLVERKGPLVRTRDGRSWAVVEQHLPSFEGLLSHPLATDACPEPARLRVRMLGWRFYDHFRTDPQAPARQPRLGTRTPVLHHDGRDLAAALQTIREIGDPEALDAAIEDAFPGSTLRIVARDGLFTLELSQAGLLRPLTAAELSDGTLRYLLLIAALLTPRPPTLMVLNEPETSLHPDLLPALGRLIVQASMRGQVWVVSHANRLVAALREASDCNCLVLEKHVGQTAIQGQEGLLDQPAWRWPDQG
ncbi:AAA family ATPase [Stutzerimonas urumqiensis]|uniref:AAA family ATPase n=1 Tax=Stutzerimonas urumqiensis TaxID=638269 RepID=UPI003BAC19E1